MSDVAPTTRIVAHRGASADFQENSIEAFVGAKDQGADGIELDVRLSADDVLVLHHDARLADGRMVREVIADELPDFVPSLAEAMEAISPLWTNIELKSLKGEPDHEAAYDLSIAVAGLIAAFGAYDQVLVSSFDMDSVLHIRELDPLIPLGWLVWGQTNPASLIARAEGHRLQAIHPHDHLVDSAFVARAHDAGLAVNVWTVDDADRARSLIEMGVDAIITNRPGALRDEL
jgi:glycerophosphoryl diester phosphodiesterase